MEKNNQNLTIDVLQTQCSEFKEANDGLFKENAGSNKTRSPLYRLELTKECNEGIRYDFRKYTVHHIDGNADTYNIDNLVIMPDTKHKNYHDKLNYITPIPFFTSLLTDMHIY